MASVFRNITVDCTDARALGWFWAQALGWQLYCDDDPEVLVTPSFPHVGTGPGMLFIPVPEPRTVKNRLHLDIQPVSGTRDDEVQRLLELGATVVEDHRDADSGGGWVWMGDPEGNDFCVEQGMDERGAPKPRRWQLTVVE